MRREVFLTKECQLTNVEGTMDTNDYHLAAILGIVDMYYVSVDPLADRWEYDEEHILV